MKKKSPTNTCNLFAYRAATEPRKLITSVVVLETGLGLETSLEIRIFVLGLDLGLEPSGLGLVLGLEPFWSRILRRDQHETSY